MCGLVGMVTKSRNGFSGANMDLMDHLLFMDQLRGPDSTGVFMVNNLGNVSIIKEASHATNFLRTQEYKNVRQDAIYNGWAMIGHNRKATRGNINDANAHPFWVEEDLVLVHNGTMWGDHKHLADVEVDSAAIAHILAGEEDVEKAMQKINAAYALIWYNIKKKQLNFLRNADRPLHWCETQDAFVVSSESEILEFACARTNTRILNEGPFTFDVLHHDVWTLTENKETSFVTNKIDAKYRTAAPAASVTNFPVPVVVENLPPLNVSLPSDLDWRVGEPWVSDEWSEHLNSQEPTTLSEGAKVYKEAMENMKTADTPEPPDWAGLHTFPQYLAAKDAYHTGKKVKVECKDYLANDAGPGMVYLTGKVVDANGFYCVFPVPKETFDWITAPHSEERKENKACFSVEIDVCAWRRAPGQSTVTTPDEKKGHITLTAKQARLIVNLETSH